MPEKLPESTYACIFALMRARRRGSKPCVSGVAVCVIDACGVGIQASYQLRQIP